MDERGGRVEEDEGGGSHGEGGGGPQGGEGEDIVVTEGKKHAVDVSKQVIGKRLRLPSKYVVSPFIVEAKMRTFVDGTYPNLFRDVDHVK